MRLFIAIDLPEEAQKALRAAQEQLPDDDNAGLSKVKEFIEMVLLKRHLEIVEAGMKLDSKSKFQETVQAQGNPTPQYRIARIEGPDHERIFTSEVLVKGKVMGEGIGPSKQEAEQAAARQALSCYNLSNAKN